ncbi:hypothetical protein ALC57_12908 [Trachymyrmex cornetzi]|uniref:Uncharacterized protein n=1 Tax=Trachymyrmex cornetzi TaxID=471704 RepID=A0A151J0A2_9HYME|nr:hypothetical protein ALC57_12908 [Trachymyrmex cornetzi]
MLNEKKTHKFDSEYMGPYKVIKTCVNRKIVLSPISKLFGNAIVRRKISCRMPKKGLNKQRRFLWAVANRTITIKARKCTIHYRASVLVHTRAREIAHGSRDNLAHLPVRKEKPAKLKI